MLSYNRIETRFRLRLQEKLFLLVTNSIGFFTCSMIYGAASVLAEIEINAQLDEEFEGNADVDEERNEVRDVE